MPYKPPLKIHRTSDDVIIHFTSVKKKEPNQKEDLYIYEYNNGIRKGSTVELTESEINKQLKNYWREI